MKFIHDQLLKAQSGALSLEEIGAEIAAVEPDTVAIDSLIVAEPDPLETEADTLEVDTADVEESIEEVQVGAEVEQSLEDTVVVMESLLASGDCSTTEYVAISEYAGSQLARLGFESFAFSAEGIGDKETRMEHLRLAMEAVQENKAKVKKALESAAKQTEEKAASLWDKLLALLGNRVKRAKVMLAKLNQAPDKAARETITVSAKVSGMLVGNDPSKTISETTKAAEYFYGGLFDDIAEWSARKSDKTPRVNNDILVNLPKEPLITFSASRMDFSFEAKANGKAFSENVRSKNELKKILNGATALFDTIKRATTKFSGLMSKIAQIYFAWNTGASAGVVASLASPVAALIVGAVNGAVGHGLLMLFSRGYNTSVKMNRVYNYFGSIGSSLVDYVGYHVAAYK